MERAHREVILGLLTRGWYVTLISRTSTLPPHPRLSWHRVMAPRRPFVLAYPVFVVAATVVLLLHRRGAVNTIGAAVLVPVDVVTVQFCHAGLRGRGPVRRSRREGTVYRASDALGSRIARGMERWCYRQGCARRFVAVSDALALEVTEAFGRRSDDVQIISNGVDRDVFRRDEPRARQVREHLALEPGRLLAVFAGGDWERKGLGIAIDAIGLTPRWELLVMGRGDVATYAAHAATVGAAVHFVGQTAEPERFYCAGDAFVFPSTYEGFALVVLEASACGLPLLVSATSGANRLVRPGVNGWFITRDAGDVASHLERLEAPDVRDAFSDAAIEASSEFAWPRIVDQYEEVLKVAAHEVP